MLKEILEDTYHGSDEGLRLTRDWIRAMDRFPPIVDSFISHFDDDDTKNIYTLLLELLPRARMLCLS